MAALVVLFGTVLLGARSDSVAFAAPAGDEGGFELSECPELTDTISRLYSATLLRQPDDAGLNFWTDEWQTGNRDLLEIADHLTSSPEFRTRYGHLGDREFVELLYQNVLGRNGESEGVDHWTDRLESERRGAIALMFSESEEFVDLTGTSDPLAGYFGRPEPTDNPACRQPLTPELLIVSDSVIGALSNSNSGAIETVQPRLPGDWDILYDGADGTWEANGGARNRPTTAGPDLIRRYEDHLDGVVVLGLGYNDAATPGFLPAMDEMLEQTADAELVVLVTLREDGRYAEWYAAANVYMAEQADARPNVVIADWAAVSAEHPGSVKRDGIHLTQSGAYLMADLLVETILEHDGPPQD